MDFEMRGSSLEEGFNTMFWSSDLNPLFTKIGSLLTIQVFGDDESYQTQQFEIPEYFYPGIFSKEYYSLIKKMDHKKLNIHKERSGITGKLMEFSSFEGKRSKRSFKTVLTILPQPMKRKLMMIYKSLQTKSRVNQLY